jgi:hypothetical protein
MVLLILKRWGDNAMYRILFIMLSAVLLMSFRHYRCYEEKFLPSIVLIPAFDSSAQTLEWNVAYEITEEIRQSILSIDGILLLNEDGTMIQVQKTGHSSLQDTLDHIYRCHGQAHYAVLIDILKHDAIRDTTPMPSCIYPVEQPATFGSLIIQARLCIADISLPNAQIILDEIVNSHQRIPPDFQYRNYHKYGWNHKGYENSPLDKAHRRLAEVIADRVESAIRNGQPIN